jgi:hypothetical protein
LYHVGFDYPFTDSGKQPAGGEHGNSWDLEHHGSKLPAVLRLLPEQPLPNNFPASGTRNIQPAELIVIGSRVAKPI